MHIAAVILSVLLALVTGAAGAPKAQFKGAVVDGLVEKGLGSALIRFIGLAEVAAAASWRASNPAPSLTGPVWWPKWRSPSRCCTAKASSRSASNT
ncbi:hypothetical protein [Streptomyces sp. NPDC086777]|uniref:hypothetical protein n=1 Tax=Streptomyces sp. NPDC086777 TaxID=3154866 RepID=UPI00344D2C24